MSTYQIEMWWSCSTCKTDCLGRHKKCTHCGKAKGREPFFDKEELEPEAAVTDAELLKQATAGSDFECKFCHSHNRRDSGECAECGSFQGDSKSHTTKWNDGTTGPAGSGMNALEEAQSLDKIEEPKVYKYVREKREGEGHFALVRKEIPVPSLVHKKATSNFKYNSKFIAIVLLVFAVLGIGSWFLFRTRIINAHVDTVAWVHMVHVERYQKVPNAGWKSEIPIDAIDAEYIQDKHHHFEKVFDRTIEEPCRVKDGQDCKTIPRVCRSIPRTCRSIPQSCTSNKNGFKTCTGGGQSCSGGGESCSGGNTTCTDRYKWSTCKKDLYKDVSIKLPYYRWSAWRWKQDRTITEKGNDNNTFWPSASKINLSDKERSSRSISYTIWFKDDDGEKHSYTPDNENEFRNLIPGSRKKVRVRLIGPNEIIK